MIRIGLNTGQAIEREGDWFGSAVNLAARAASLAAGGEVLATEATREAAGDVSGIEWQARGPRAFKNVAQQVSIFAALASERSGSGMAVDPVCRMALDPASAAGDLTHRGARYHFCSLRCAGAFAANPDHYASAALAADEE
jgi:adenylate cyclase